MNRTIIIGDVHGCIDEARQLLDEYGYAPGVEVVFVGDMVGRGPDSVGVIGLARSTGARAVRGNHEQAWLRFREGLSQGEPSSELKPREIESALTLTEQDWNFISSLPCYLRLPEYGVVVVHAGLLPAVPLSEQEPELMLNLRSIRPDGSGSSRQEEGVAWASLWPGPEEVVFGHHASAGLQRHPHATGLDTGCVYGKRLTAYLLPERELVSVPARRAYRPIPG